MKPSRLILFFFSACLAWPAAGSAADSAPTASAAPSANGVVVLTAPQTGEVVNPVDRDRLLAAASHDLNRADPALEANIQTFDNPFFLKLPPPPPEIQPSSPTTTTAPVPVVVRLADADKLAQLSAVLKPSGTMGMGSKLALIFEDRPPLRAGQVMEVTFPGEDAPTRILLLSVSQKSYSLKLNDTVLPVSLNRPTTDEGSPPSPNSKP